MEVETLSPLTVQAEVKKYTLVGDDIYVKRYTNDTIPDWYRSIISNILSTDNLITDLESVIDFLSSLPAGYNQLITSLQNKDLLIDTSLESLVTRDAEKSAAIASLWTTKTDATSAQAIALNVIGSYFNDGSAGSWFSNQISTYASRIAANASSISTLAASLDGQEVRIDTIDTVTMSQADQIDTIKTIDLPALQNQIDGSITTWFYDSVPTLLNAPADGWLDVATKNAHLGDIYYNKTTGYGYRFAYEDIVDTPDMGMIYTWIRITDVDVTSALANAATAQDTADGKSVVHYQATAPTGKTAADAGDTWVNSNTNILSTWNGTSWVLPQTTWSASASKLITSPDGSITGWSFGDGSNTKSYFQIHATNFKISDGATGYTPFSIVGGNIYLNGKVEFSNINNIPPINKTYSQTSTPTSGMIIGDVWLDTDDNNKVYTYTTAGWTPPPSGVKTYAQASAPTSGMVVGDLWYNTANNNLVSRYSGSAWVGVLTDPATYINANTTTINGGKITSGTITAGEINVANLKASNLFVDNELKSSDFSAITGAGFRLKSNAAGTNADPTIYGSYIRGGFIDASTLIIDSLRGAHSSSMNNSGRLILSKISTVTAVSPQVEAYGQEHIFYSRLFSSGFLETRLAHPSATIIVQMSASVTGLTAGNFSVGFQINRDGAGWVNLAPSGSNRILYMSVSNGYYSMTFAFTQSDFTNTFAVRAAVFGGFTTSGTANVICTMNVNNII